MASILTVANVHFDTTAYTRIDHVDNDGILRINSKAIKVAAGPTAYQPSVGEVGLIRYNTTLTNFEFYWPSGWANVISQPVLTATNNSIQSSITAGNTFIKSALTDANNYLQSAITTTNNFILATMAGANTLILATANNWANTKLTNSTATLAGSLTTTGNIKSSSDVSDSKGDVRKVPINTKSSAYDLAAADVGKFISISAGGVNVKSGIFTAGDAVSVYNNSGSSQTIGQGTSVTMYLGGSSSTGNRTIAQRGIATILCVGSNEFVITGSGVS